MTYLWAVLLATDFNGRGWLTDSERVFIDDLSHYSCSNLLEHQPTEFILFFLLKEFKMYIKF